MKYSIIITIILMALLTNCTFEFFPDIEENENMLVVEGMITDQNRINRVRLSRSAPVGTPLIRKPVRGASVTVTDENGVVTNLTESPPGTYSTDSTLFTGRVGGKYALQIKINNRHYETSPVEMKPVPPVDRLYYEKVVLNAERDSDYVEEGCRILVDAFDPSGRCNFFRWEYTETWEYKIPYDVVNRICYITERSDEIITKNTTRYSQSRVSGYPVLLITNKSDRLRETYSILVKQYSLDEEEYNFWAKVENISQNVGSLYDMIPMSITGNIRCTEDPDETVLGYFSVSAVKQKRLFINDRFLGLPNFYSYCATDTLRGSLPESGLNSSYWIIEDYGNELPPYWVITTFRECADCTTRGTTVRPAFWDEER